MKVSFTQTYGNDRKQLLDIKFKDKKLIEFLSHFDINIFSFHNCNQKIIDYFIEHNNIPNTKIQINNDITYTQCIKRLLHTLNLLNAKYFFFNQDDTFSFDNDNVDFKELLNFIFSEKEIMLNLSYEKNNFTNLKVFKNLESIKIFISSTLTFAKQNLWSFDDSPYICTTNLLPEIYDDSYIQCVDIWSAEHYLNNKFKQKNLKRFVTNKRIFKNYNFLGPNNWNHEQEIKILTQKQFL